MCFFWAVSSSESLKYLGYVPEGVWINHNLDSPEIRLHGNP